MIPFSPPRIDDKIIAEVVDTLKSGWITTGPKTKLFEKKLTEYTGGKSTLCVNSATAGLEIALRWFGVGQGDEVPNSVTYIGWEAFSGCSGLESIVVDSDNHNYDSRNDCNAIIETETNTLINGCKSTIIPNSVTSIGDGAFSSCSGLTDVTIPNSVTSIGPNAFKDCNGLTSVTIPNSVTSIGYMAFYYCSGLTSITIPESVTSIGGWAFRGCSRLTTINFNATNCTTMGSQSNPVFSTALATLNIGENVTNIPNYAFYGCSRINAVYSNATNPPTIYSNTFEGVSSNVPVYVPCGRVSAYNNAQYWSNFTNIQQNPDCAGVEENEIANLQVFPNPVGSTLNITSSETISEIEIVNMLGQVVYSMEVNADNAVCHVEGLTSGIYVVRIRTLSGAEGAEIQRKFIKE